MTFSERNSQIAVVPELVVFNQCRKKIIALKQWIWSRRFSFIHWWWWWQELCKLMDHTSLAKYNPRTNGSQTEEISYLLLNGNPLSLNIRQTWMETSQLYLYLDIFWSNNSREYLARLPEDFSSCCCARALLFLSSSAALKY